jgi:hypothetical protein
MHRWIDCHIQGAFEGKSAKRFGLLIRLMVDLASKADFGWTQWLYHFD